MTLHAVQPLDKPEHVAETMTLKEGSIRAGVPYSTFCRAVRCGTVPGLLVFGPRTFRLSRSVFEGWLQGVNTCPAEGGGRSGAGTTPEAGASKGPGLRDATVNRAR